MLEVACGMTAEKVNGEADSQSRKYSCGPPVAVSSIARLRHVPIRKQYVAARGALHARKNLGPKV